MYKLLFTQRTNDSIIHGGTSVTKEKIQNTHIPFITKKYNKYTITTKDISSFRTYQNKGLISLGDHCAISEILKQLNLRNYSFPFDWNACPGLLKNSNISCNLKMLDLLLKTNGDAKEITQMYLGNFFENSDKINTENNIWFPHEDGTKTEIFAKYERRFTRLYEYLHKHENIFFMVNRDKFIPPEEMNQYLDILLSCNQNNKVIFISGKPHTYLENNNEKYTNILFKHIYYDLTKFYDYDYSDFRPNIRKFLMELFSIYK